MPSIGNDDRRITTLAAEHFISHGFRRFAFFGPAGRKFSQQRAEHFKQVLRKKGFDCEIFFTRRSEPQTFGWHTFDPAVVNWLSKLPKPIGILAANDMTGLRLLRSAPHANVRVPDDVAVVGIDNDELVCRITSPPMSSIDTSDERIGFEAAAMLDKMLRGRQIKPRQMLIEPRQLVIRQSSDVLAVSNPHVSDAVRYIRENVPQNLSVKDVMREIPVGRRTLERAFQASLGRSIHDEIIESRIRRARQLLIETEMSIPDISAACGFSNRTHLDAVFRRQTKNSPAAFRREYRKTK